MMKITDEPVEVVGWSYEYHDFGEIWPRGVILNRPDGEANPPTAHHGSPVRSVTPLVRQSALTACQQEVERLRAASIASGNALYEARTRNAELVKALEKIAEIDRESYSVGQASRGMDDVGKIARAALKGQSK